MGFVALTEGMMVNSADRNRIAVCGDVDSPSRASPQGGGVAHGLRALAQPWTLVLVLILLLNDHVLRWRWPSWATGKLGDVAWLGFAPLVVAVPLALAWRALADSSRSEPGGRRRAGSCDLPLVLSMVLVAAVFAVVKASPGAAAWFREAFSVVFGWTPLLVSDPTDLLTLPALWIAWRLWQVSAAGMGNQEWRMENQESRIVKPEAGSQRRGAVAPRRAWWVLGLAALATLANSGPPDTGLTCVVFDEARSESGEVVVGPRYVYAYTPPYASDDGGLTWSMLTGESFSTGPWAEAVGARCVDRGSTWVLADEAEGLQFRFTQGQGIERSLDAGQTWRPSLMLSGEEARQAYYQVTRTTLEGGAGPHDALVDPGTGNVIVAMGHEGVLVLPRAGRGASEREGQDAAGDAWRWVAVGEYRFEPITRLGQVLTLLQDEIGLALAAACVAVALCAWWLMKWPGRAITVLVAGAIVVMLPAVRPATVSGYGGAVVALMTVGIAVVAVILAVVAAIKGKRRLAWALASAFATGVVCLAPFVLWAISWIQSYSAAAWIAVVITVVAWAACVQRSPRR